ncbi:MAG: nucleotidyl transferase AbiEii/AbiGii toxin family protein [Luteolibacter sp.]
MSEEPRFADDYVPRQITAARRVIVDVMQVMASFRDCLVLVGGWVPDLTIENPEEPHVGSIDVDLALDVGKLNEGRYAEMLKLLLATKRYRQGDKAFQFITEVDLADGLAPVAVEVEFLAPKEIKIRKNKPTLLEGFRVLQADGCSAAFHSPHSQKLTGQMVNGATNTVSLQVASVPDFLVMKAFALNGRDKPKDAYDICYCLDHYPGGISELAEAWLARIKNDDIAKAIGFFREKFESINAYGPMQVVEFYNEADPETRQQQARRAFELVQQFLAEIESESVA